MVQDASFLHKMDGFKFQIDPLNKKNVNNDLK